MNTEKLLEKPSINIKVSNSLVVGMEEDPEHAAELLLYHTFLHTDIDSEFRKMAFNWLYKNTQADDHAIFDPDYGYPTISVGQLDVITGFCIICFQKHPIGSVVYASPCGIHTLCESHEKKHCFCSAPQSAKIPEQEELKNPAETQESNEPHSPSKLQGPSHLHNSEERQSPVNHRASDSKNDAGMPQGLHHPQTQSLPAGSQKQPEKFAESSETHGKTALSIPPLVLA